MAAVPVLALTFGAHVVNVAVLAGLAALGALFDPAGMTARETMLPEAAQRAGWTLDHANSVYEAVFNLSYIVGPGHRRPDDRHARRREHHVGDRGRLRAVDPRHLDTSPRRRGHTEPQRATRGGVGRRRRRAALRLEQQGAAHAGDRGPRSDRPVHADGISPVPQIFHRPQRTRTTGLGADGAQRRRPHRRAGLCGAVEVFAPAHRHADRRADARRGDDDHRVPAAAAADPGAVRDRRVRLRPDRADLQLRHADPRAATPARAGRRRDGVAGLRRRAARPGAGGPARRCRRSARDVPGAVAADAAAWRRRGVSARTSRSGPRSDRMSATSRRESRPLSRRVGWVSV